MISAERAAECVGRLVQHDSFDAVRGVVHHVHGSEVWVDVGDNEVIPCDPSGLSWVNHLHPAIVTAIKNGEDYEDAQIGYDKDPSDMFSVIYSTRIANDDGTDHALYFVLHQTKKVAPIRINANPWVPFQVEEILGWKNP